MFAEYFDTAGPVSRPLWLEPRGYSFLANLQLPLGPARTGQRGPFFWELIVTPHQTRQRIHAGTREASPPEACGLLVRRILLPPVMQLHPQTHVGLDTAKWSQGMTRKILSVITAAMLAASTTGVFAQGSGGGSGGGSSGGSAGSSGGMSGSTSGTMGSSSAPSTTGTGTPGTRSPSTTLTQPCSGSSTAGGLTNKNNPTAGTNQTTNPPSTGC